MTQARGLSCPRSARPSVRYCFAFFWSMTPPSGTYSSQRSLLDRRIDEVLVASPKLAGAQLPGTLATLRALRGMF
jgi:hypothetical protein